MKDKGLISSSFHFWKIWRENNELYRNEKNVRENGK